MSRSESTKARLSLETPEQRLARTQAGVAAMHAATRLANESSGPVREITPADMVKYMPWVLANLDNRGVQRSDEPGPGAYRMLRDIRKDKVLRNKLYATVLDIAAKTDVTASERFTDDGRDVIAYLDEFEASLKKGEGEIP